ncbi:MAG: hypothetical protein LBL90_13915 [Prevotellaceae bacterium]|jgi:preprotein translocase subunit SecG|nr:hypothetical protein [Prevotellaceae bacterium]
MPRVVHTNQHNFFRYIIMILGVLFVIIMYIMLYNITNKQQEQPKERGYPIELKENTGR